MGQQSILLQLICLEGKADATLEIFPPTPFWVI